MNAIELSNYFSSKYQSKFGSYPRFANRFRELHLFKQLLDKYSKYLLLEAVDRFFEDIEPEKANIYYFSKIFSSKFASLIKLEEVCKYQRLSSFFEDPILVKDLIQRYQNYAFAISLSLEDIGVMRRIVKMLEAMPCKKN